MRLFTILAMLLPLFAFSGRAEPAEKVVYRILGVAVSSRDGTPVPYCRMQIAVSRAGVAAEPRRGGTPPGGGEFGQRNRRQEPAEVDADVRGHFQITVDHPGSYTLTGSARDYRRQNFDVHEGFFSNVVLTSAVPTVNIVFRLERDASVTGLVLDEAGEPVRNAQITAEAPGQTEERPGNRFRGGGGDGRQAGFAQTDDRGRYEISGLAPGAYRLRVQAQPWYTQGANARVFGNVAGAAAARAGSPDPSLDLVYPVSWFPGVQDESAAEPLQLSGGEERQADFHLSPVPSVHLLVPRPEPTATANDQQRPPRGATLVRVSPAGGFSQMVSTNGATQDFGGLSPGIYELRNFGQDGRADVETKQFRVLPGSSGVVNLSAATVLTKVTLAFDGAESDEAGQFTFVDTASGRSVGADGGFEGFAGRRRDDGNGAERERAVYLSAGRWEVRCSPFASIYLTGVQATGAAVQGATLQVGDQPVSLTLRVGTGRGEISGIAAVNGQPTEGAMVLLVPATLGEPGSIAEIEREQTNTDGSFTLRGVVPGKYILLAIDHGWAVKWRDPATLAGYLARGVPLQVESKAKIQQNINSVEP